MRQAVRDIDQKAKKPSTWWLTLPSTVVLVWGIATAVASLLALDRFREGMLLTYPPRYLCLAVTIAASSVFAACGCRKRAWIAMSCCGLLGVQFGWGPASLGAAVDRTDGFTILAFNVHDQTAHVAKLAELCRKENVDFLLLQEVRPENRSAFVNGLSEFDFVHADESQTFEHSDHGPFSSLIGIHRSLKGQQPVEIDTAITGYRTFALRLPIRKSTSAKSKSEVTGIWLVNVHTTKAFWTADGLTGLHEKADMKSAWHVKERALLESWLARHRSEPVILGGDFNAPWNSHNLRINGLDNAHLSSGAGPHLTFPRAFPVCGLDHILGTAPIEFLSYRILDTGYSDHCAQIGRFRIRGFQRERPESDRPPTEEAENAPATSDTDDEEADGDASQVPVLDVASPR
ncbi:MAG: endonuclease/exonuclease/phosphatase family protein [Planctomycetota bacterium]|nr:endonuclease/exonuclease/phosphatase family protein [Planctomycetota bacterium]MDA1250292.1 endonuclease/exonuclease/phosphatase family protein [Planctomycetota bacterium]